MPARSAVKEFRFDLNFPTISPAKVPPGCHAAPPFGIHEMRVDEVGLNLGPTSRLIVRNRSPKRASAPSAGCGYPG